MVSREDSGIATAKFRLMFRGKGLASAQWQALGARGTLVDRRGDCAWVKRTRSGRRHCK